MKSSELLSSVFDSTLPFAVKNNIGLVQLVKLMDLAFTNLEVAPEDKESYLDTIKILNKLAFFLGIAKEFNVDTGPSAIYYSEDGIEKMRVNNKSFDKYKEAKKNLYETKDPKTANLLAEWIQTFKVPTQYNEGDSYDIQKT